MSTPLAKGSAVVNRMAVLAFPILLLNVTVSNLKKKEKCLVFKHRHVVN